MVLSETGSRTRAGEAAGPSSDIFSLVSLGLSLLELSGAGGGSGSPYFLGLDGNSLGLLALSFCTSFADSVSTTCALSLDSCHRALSISNSLLSFFSSL